MSTFRPAAKLFKLLANAQEPLVSQSAQFSSKKKGGADKCQKMASTVPPSGTHIKCKKLKVAGCDSRARENCNPIFRKRDACHKLEAPFASYSECLKEPPPHRKRSECPRKDSGFPPQCRVPNEGISIDGCDPPEPKALGACEKRKRAPPRSNACKKKTDGCDPSIKPFKNP